MSFGVWRNGSKVTAARIFLPCLPPSLLPTPLHCGQYYKPIMAVYYKGNIRTAILIPWDCTIGSSSNNLPIKMYLFVGFTLFQSEIVLLPKSPMTNWLKNPWSVKVFHSMTAVIKKPRSGILHKHMLRFYFLHLENWWHQLEPDVDIR